VLLFDLAGQSEESMARSDGIKLWTQTYISCSMPSDQIDSIRRGCPNVALSSSLADTWTWSRLETGFGPGFPTGTMNPGLKA
jgi:hypothetical protein